MTGTAMAVRIRVRGRVQGVGFRPFVFRLATTCHLNGRVSNHTEGALIEVEGRADDVASFSNRLVKELPTPAVIEDLSVESAAMSGCGTFTIGPSDAAGPMAMRVPTDASICSECRGEMFETDNRRHRYPFTNCTACGPRYSIIESMPYDRPATTMRIFEQCIACAREYQSPADRRFHAQPNACAKCGPRLALWDRQGTLLGSDDAALLASVEMLRRGEIVALKGVGGFQILVRADDAAAVQRLRVRKRRPTKPLAVMVGSLEAAGHMGQFDESERKLLCSPQNPIVVMRKAVNSPLAEAIAPGLNHVGLFLPTTPLHALLMAELGLPVVATSGNRGDEPIVIDECDVVGRLGGIADAFLVHDRPIVRRLDDSVMSVMESQIVSIRMARGYAPLPLTALEDFDGPHLLAVSGHQKAALALWNGRQAVLGQHVGDLDNVDTRLAFETAVRHLEDLYQGRPTVIACDLHPDYFTSHWAEQRGARIIRVQHHHAHAAAAQVEHRLLSDEVLAVTWDGTGYGPDGTLWGGEFLRVHGQRFDRVASLLPFPLPGGEAAIRQPNRIALGLLQGLFGAQAVLQQSRWLKHLTISNRQADHLTTMIRRNVNTSRSTSVGRLFDGVAALIIPMTEVTYEGEAAIRLEALADRSVDDQYEMPIIEAEILRGDWRPLVKSILKDLENEVDSGIIAARFHNTLASWVVSLAERWPGLKIVLGGGCFQNRLLTHQVAARLRSAQRLVFPPGIIPPGDGGLAAGQLAVAMATLRSEAGCSNGRP